MQEGRAKELEDEKDDDLQIVNKILPFAKTTTMETQTELRGIFKLTRTDEIQLNHEKASRQVHKLIIFLLACWSKRNPKEAKNNLPSFEPIAKLQKNEKPNKPRR